MDPIVHGVAKSQTRLSGFHFGFPGGPDGKASALLCNARDPGSIAGSGRSSGERKWQPTPVFLPGKLYGQRSPMGYSP